ncbi:hypothetical protein QTN47_04195 [Danxiaibacter flavus]|uniref:Polymerase nucleotidyl transferase domain-containing protein n=1 Tax=Danxiaibacter flavus TaxID=3049108 RepID=A0ABV3Z9Z0_9BACT|nr:hypothetical protein QNM32_04195 [Chitinophagaceae bacterium DXS]
MEKKDLIPILKQYFPHSVGCMLNGSQVRNIQLSSGSDIDVFIFDLLFSHITTYSFEHDGYLLDVTIIPLIDIQNVLSDACNEVRGAMLTAIIESEILDDTNSIIRDIQHKATEYYTIPNPGRAMIYNDLVYQLKKIAVKAKKKISPLEKIIYVSDFIGHITSVECFRASGWIPTKKAKADFLLKERPDFAEKIIHIFNEVVVESKLDFLSQYVEDYLKMIPPIENFFTASDELVLDISIGGIERKDDAFKLIFLIKDNSLLNSHFRYFFFSPKKYFHTFKNDICIVFKCRDLSLELVLLDALKKLYYSAFHNELVCYKIFGWQFRLLASNVKPYVDALKEQICSFLLITYIERRNETLFLAFIICVLEEVLMQCRTELQDCIKANFILMQRLLFATGQEADIRSYTELINERNFRYGFLEDKYMNIANELKLLIEKQGRLPCNMVETISQMIAHSNEYNKSLPPYLNSVLQLFEIKPVSVVTVYMLLVEEVLSMCYNSDDGLLVLYYLTKMHQSKDKRL